MIQFLLKIAYKYTYIFIFHQTCRRPLALNLLYRISLRGGVLHNDFQYTPIPETFAPTFPPLHSTPLT